MKQTAIVRDWSIWNLVRYILFVNFESMINFQLPFSSAPSSTDSIQCLDAFDFSAVSSLWYSYLYPQLHTTLLWHYVVFSSFRLSCLCLQCWVMWCLKCSFYEIVFSFFLSFMYVCILLCAFFSLRFLLQADVCVCLVYYGHSLIHSFMFILLPNGL